MVVCGHCGREAPDETFCTWCGARLGAAMAGAASPKGRRQHFAAFPGEHVNQPSVITTLLPHLPGSRVHEFRWILAAGVALVAILVSTGLIVASILVAAVLVPVLYLAYLFETEVYRDTPAAVIGITIGGGAVLGAVFTVIVHSVISTPPPLFSRESVGYLVGTTVLVPIIAEIVKPIPPLLLRRSKQFTETIDGLVFGVAAGLGFAAAETIVNFSKVITDEPVHTRAAQWLFPVMSIAVLTPLLQATCTGVIVAALWRPGRTRRSLLFATAIPIALAAHVLFSWVSQVMANHAVGQGTILFWQAAVLVPLLVYLRHLVHYALLEEAADLGFAVVVCPGCHREEGAAAFCPHCGGAVTAGPRRAGRQVVEAVEVVLAQEPIDG